VLLQVGCALKCSFCATGKGGLGRNLKSHEIVDQVFCCFVLLVFSLSIELAFDNLVGVLSFSEICIQHVLASLNMLTGISLRFNFAVIFLLVTAGACYRRRV
jgi:hypothetical protein